LPGSGAQLYDNETVRQSIHAQTRLSLPFMGIFGNAARSGATAMRTAKRDRPSAQCIHECVISVHSRLFHGLRDQHLSSAGPTESVQFCTDAAASASAMSPLGRRQRRVAVDDAQRYRANAADCILAAERFGPAYRYLTLDIAESWLSLARQQEVTDGLLAIWSDAQSVRIPAQIQLLRVVRVREAILA
jgi:hypothetical protein